MRSRVLVTGVFVVVGLPGLVMAQQPPAPADAQKDAEPPVYREVVVVTASRTEQQLINAPAAISVVSSETIATTPAGNMGDLLRAVPGVNVTQTSARDVNLTTRGATGTLATSQLALVDGRSIYLDFFGMVMWDLVPTSTDEIKQIEVIRGPASAVWGANAMSGVVNVITKTPRELAAERRGTVTMRAGLFDRDVPGRDQSNGTLLSISGAYADVINDRWAYKVSAGYLTQDPLPRPTGTIPNPFHTPYPAFTNFGTTQPKLDGRVDYEMEGGGRITVSGGVGGTEGILFSGIGPFNVESGSRLTYVSARYSKGTRRVGVFTNLLSGSSSNLLTTGVDREPLRLIFDTKTFDIDAGDATAIGVRHLLTYGGNVRRNTFDFSLALSGEARSEGGGYIQDEIFLNNHLRWVVGGRLDKFSSIEHAVFSPRTTLLVKPSPPHTIRLSFNRAFRAPSFTNNNLDTTLTSELNLGLVNPALAGRLYTFPVRAVGYADLKQETMTAYEIGYTGVVRQRATVTASIYWNRTKDAILFTQTERYSSATPPPGWPLPPVTLDLIAAAGSPLPSEFSYRNLGTVKDRGVELGVEGVISRVFSAYTNYSYQFEPQTVGFPLTEINLPPRHRVNAGVNVSYGRTFGSLSVSFTDEAFWQDVLDVRFHGETEPYTLVNGSAGVRWANNRIVTSVKALNLVNRAVMQHVLGDVLKRQIVAEVAFGF